MDKLSIVHIDLGGCEGCSVSIYRALLKVEEINFYSKLSGDFILNGNEIIIVSGPICLNETDKVEFLKEIREKSKVLIAFGSCSAIGGITRYCRGGQQPKPNHVTFQPINTIVDVDYAIPGCPPPPNFLKPFIELFVSGKNSRFIQIFKAVAKIKKLSGFDLIDDIILQNICVGCGACVLSCPTNALHMVGGRPNLIAEKCIRCGICYVRCPKGAQLLLRRCLK